MLMTTLPSGTSQASDHDDGETDLKSRSLNLTDVYVFREDKEIGGGSAAHLVFLINSNPRSLPQQQYYFSTSARYELHIGRVGTSKDVPAVTDSDVTIRFEFGAPSASGIQAMSMTTIIDGVSSTYTSKDGGGAINTTPLSGAGAPVVSDVTVGGRVFKVFAGLRRDPFFFDVTAFFRFRLAAAGTGGNTPVPGFAAFPTYIVIHGVDHVLHTMNLAFGIPGSRYSIGFFFSWILRWKFQSGIKPVLRFCRYR